MRWFVALTFALLVRGNTAYANTSATGDCQKLQTITSWMAAYLNANYPDLNIVLDAELASKKTTLRELQLLEDVLQGSRELPAGALQQIACDRPACGGGGGGKCRTCY